MTVIPVFDSILVPDVNLYFKKSMFEAAAGHEPAAGERVVLLPAKTAIDQEGLSEDDFYEIALAGTVADPEVNGYVVGNVVKQYMMQWSSVAEVAAGLSSRLMISSSEKYDILAEDSLAKRTELMERAIYEFLEVSKLSNEAASAQQEDHQKMYRESAIKKQMEYLQNELDEMHPENVSDVRKLEERIGQCGVSGEAKEEALKVLGRMKQNGSSSPEYGMLYDYLDFLTAADSGNEPEKETGRIDPSVRRCTRYR